ncbi:MAG: hypothetical protein ACOH1I_09205 [Gallionellaceae bacterium]
MHKISVVVIIIGAFLYAIDQGSLKFLIPLIPFFGLLIHIKPFENERHIIFGMVVSTSTVFIVNIAAHYGHSLGFNFINNQSQLYVYAILLNLIFFRSPIMLPVLSAVVNSVLLNPSPIGNRSGAFLIFFIFNKEYYRKLINGLRKLKLSTIFIALFIIIGLSLIAFKIISSPKYGDDYHESRFEWAADVLLYVYDNGVADLWMNAEGILPVSNPHNSFLYLLMYESLVGIFKNIIFICSIFIIPLSSWFVIALRASFDSFFFVGPLGILFGLLIRSFLTRKDN